MATRPKATPPQKNQTRTIVIAVVASLIAVSVLYAGFYFMNRALDSKTQEPVSTAEAAIPDIQNRLEAFYNSRGYYPAKLSQINVNAQVGKLIYTYEDGEMTKAYEKRNPVTVNSGNYTGKCDYRLSIQSESYFGISGDSVKTSDKVWTSPPKATCSLTTER